MKIFLFLFCIDCMENGIRFKSKERQFLIRGSVFKKIFINNFLRSKREESSSFNLCYNFQYIINLIKYSSMNTYLRTIIKKKRTRLSRLSLRYNVNVLSSSLHYFINFFPYIHISKKQMQLKSVLPTFFHLYLYDSFIFFNV